MSNMMRAVPDTVTELWRGVAKLRYETRSWDYEKRAYVNTGVYVERTVYTGAYAKRGTAANVLSGQIRGYKPEQIVERRIERSELKWETSL